MMWDFKEVASVKYRNDYVYHIGFDDGAEADVDFSEYLDKGPVFVPLRELEFFQQARVEGGTIAWPNGADIAPETLYDKVAQVSSLLKQRG